MNPSPKKILFLYNELAGYFLACIEKLSTLYDVEIHVVRYPLNPVAPFEFKFNDHIKYYERKNYNRTQLIALAKEINPDLIFTGGWMDKDYIAVSKSFKNIPVVLTSDMPWLGSVKQNIATVIGPLYLPRIFTHCWVPGEPNAVYARKFGFKNDRLLTGMYSADFDLFQQYYLKNKESKGNLFPKKFIYVGRYSELKGVKELWQAFIQLQNEQPNEWELWCLGKGEYDNDFPQHDKIKNFGFIQPKDLSKFIGETGVFILPTHYEHWGVVVHEFAAAGFPLICSTTTSAATTFLREAYNGFYTKPKEVATIVEAMKKTISLSDKDLFEMGERSVELSKQITPETWSNTLMNLLNK